MSYIKLDRKILDWGWFQDGNMLKVWIYLLVNAKYADCMDGGEFLKRGQLKIGRKKLAKETGLSEQSVRTCINRLISTNEITIKTTNKYSVITINKYSEYQDGIENINQQINQLSNQQSTNNQPTTNHYIKNIRNKEIKNIYNTLPVYDSSKNVNLSEEQEKEIMSLMKGTYENNNIQ